MFLTLSDSAKFAEAAKSFLAGNGLAIHHSFFSPTLLEVFQSGTAWPAGFLPLTSVILSLFFRLLPANDFTISLVGYFFLALSTALVFLIAQKLHSSRAGIVSAVLMFASPFFLDYAQNASSDIVFTTEILLFVYLTLQKKLIRWPAIFPLLLMFLTRQQAVLFLLALPVYYICFYQNSQRFRFAAVLLALLVFMGLYSLSRKDVSSIYSPLKPFYSAQMAVGVSQGQYLRGLTYSPEDAMIRSLLVKVFYNVYNFAKSPERLAPTAIFLLFLFSFFDRRYRHFTNFAATIFAFFVFGASASLPNARYVHPVVPLIYISAGISLVQVLTKYSPNHINYKIGLVMFFLTLPTIGNVTLDARFRRQQFNVDKPPVYREISRVMAENIPRGKLIITNLDAWAAWYEGLTTMWFPVSPNQLDGFQDKVDYIVITNYKEDDGDFALGEWRDVVYTPNQINSPFLKKYYRILKTFTIDRTEVYENRNFQGTILVRRI